MPLFRYTAIIALLAAFITCEQFGCSQPFATLSEIMPVCAANGGLPVQMEFDRPFADCDGLVLRMDVFRPTSADQPTPAVVLLHGGFWTYGERWFMHDWAVDLATQGYAAASIDYRLLWQGGQYPAPVADVLAAVAHLREHAAELNIDPQRIALFGASAGAHLALLAGMAADASIFDATWPPGQSASVTAIVDIYGPTDFTLDPQTAQPWQLDLVANLLGGTADEQPQRYQEASPASHARADGPPVLILHGTADPIVPIAQARALRDALEAAGQACQYIEVPGASHFWGSAWTSPEVQQHREAILQFLVAAFGP
jgi:acetyl esterase/lipase